MKKLLINCLATTALTIMMHAAISAIFFGASLMFIKNVFEILAVNLVVHIGLIFVQKFEIKYIIIERIVEVAFVLIVVLPAGFLFDWYSTNSMWIVLIICVVIYFVGCFIDIMKVNDEIADINKLIAHRMQHIDEQKK